MRTSAIAMSENGFKLQGRHVLAMFLSFFGIIMLVNGYFLYSALSTNTGIVAKEPYRKGLEYNQRIAAEEQQNKLGWRDDLTLGNDGRLSVIMSDAAGAPLHHLHVTAMVGRPSTERHDHKLVLGPDPSGAYVGSIGQLEAGNWIASVEVRKSADEAPIYRFRRRLLLKP